ncbi:hypothetical protein [Pseudorhodoferax sp. Leaf265]|uniref:hypothetical protein n=1 Tax=Pseudorhodoferax sp. Leaf265 TaxID=1736315 RepID=UPI0006F1CC9E|nr:hypothetical protein [Pseudorhodoferax sp. Leaf265]KQP02500.1 hypothetical protein ASF45_20825 [Pseudorhodoferax sp. Leaf265]
MADKKTTLANGAGLTAETWADFVARLHHDVKGEGVSRHYTADATFLVEKRVWREVPEENSDIRQIYCDGHTETPADFFADKDEETQAKYNEAAGGSFLEADSYEMREALAKLIPEAHLLHVVEDWEFVCQHFTRDAADAFIKRKGHDYRDGLRVYVDCTCYSWELNTIKAAILDGRIGLLPAVPSPAEGAGNG